MNELRELDHRAGDGLDVTLYWRPSDDRTLVAVADARTGTSFTVEVRDGQRPLDVFHHPYAYADPALSAEYVRGLLADAA